jgi:hypothetical protein
MLDVLGVSHVIKVGDGAIYVGDGVLLCLKGESFLRVAGGCAVRISEFLIFLG